MDDRLYHCFCVILIDCIGFLMRLRTFGSTGCHVRARYYGLLEYHELCVRMTGKTDAPVIHGVSAWQYRYLKFNGKLLCTEKT